MQRARLLAQHTHAAFLSARTHAQLLQGMFSALGGAGGAAAAGAGAGAAAAAPLPPHLLATVADYLQQLTAAGAAAQQLHALPLTARATGAAAGACTTSCEICTCSCLAAARSLTHARAHRNCCCIMCVAGAAQQGLTAALQHVLAGQQLTAAQQAELARAVQEGPAAGAGALLLALLLHACVAQCTLCVTSG